MPLPMRRISQSLIRTSPCKSNTKKVGTQHAAHLQLPSASCQILTAACVVANARGSGTATRATYSPPVIIPAILARIVGPLSAMRITSKAILGWKLH